MRKYSVTASSASFYLKSSHWKSALKEAGEYFKKNELLTVSLRENPRWMRIGGQWYRLESVK